jgi:hypothetical protein
MLNFMALDQPQECFCFLTNFRNLATKKKKRAGESDKGIFEVLKNKIAIS